MHFFDFLQLDENEQIELLWYNGQHIGTRKDGELMMLLYQLEAFYVEVFYHTKERIIKRYLCFECTDLLDPYLNNVDLSPIYRYLNKKTKKGDTIQVASSVESNQVIGGKTIIKKAGQNRLLSNIMSGLYHAFFQKKVH